LKSHPASGLVGMFSGKLCFGSAMIPGVKKLSWSAFRCLLGILLVTSASWLVPTPSAAEVTVFLQDGRTIQAEGTEVIGDRIRITKPAETIELPRSAVLSIHQVSPPEASPSPPLPADVYRNLTQQMTDKVRGEIQGQAGVARGK
jgi:hypothetical protein